MLPLQGEYTQINQAETKLETTSGNGIKGTVQQDFLDVFLCYWPEMETRCTCRDLQKFIPFISLAHILKVRSYTNTLLLKVPKRENFLGSDIEICSFSQLVMHKY